MTNNRVSSFTDVFAITKRRRRYIAAWYNFKSDGSQLLETVVNDADGTYIHYEYTATEPYRVTRVWSNSTQGANAILFDHSYDYRDILTIVTDNLSGKKIRYHFNDSGNLVSISDELGYGAASTYATDGPINKQEAISKLQRSVVNLVRDPTFSTSNVWIEGHAAGTGTNCNFTHWYRFTYDSIRSATTKTEIQLPNRNIASAL
jgi:hypothetical protein